MKLADIKQAVDEGNTVCHHNRGYVVKKSKAGDYVIVYTPNGYTIGLTWRDGVTMNGKEEDFFITHNEREWA